MGYFEEIASGEPEIHCFSHADLLAMQDQSPETPLFDAFALTGEVVGESITYRLTRFGGLCLCLAGSGEILVRQQPYSFSSNDMLVLFPHTSVQIIHCSTDFRGYIFCFHESLLDNIVINSLADTYLLVESEPYIHLETSSLRLIVGMCEHLVRQYAAVSLPLRQEITQTLMSLICYEVAALYLVRKPIEQRPYSRYDECFRNFMQLLGANFLNEREVAFYAQAMCITPRYLTSAVKRVSGITPSEWLARVIVQKAKELLATTTLTVQQISDELNFPTASFFGQYFKRHVGTTPRLFRMNLPMK